MVQVKGLDYLLSGRYFERQLLHLAGIHSLRFCVIRKESKTNHLLMNKSSSSFSAVGSSRGIFSAMQTEPTDVSITYLGQLEAQKLDQDLMGPLGFSVDQLMEVC